MPLMQEILLKRIKYIWTIYNRAFCLISIPVSVHRVRTDRRSRIFITERWVRKLSARCRSSATNSKLRLQQFSFFIVYIIAF